VAHLKCKPGHGVNAGVTAGDESGVLSAQCGPDGRAHAVHFFFHSRADDDLLFYQWLDKTDVGGIPHNDIDRLQDTFCTLRQVFQVTGTDAYDVKDIRATAMVTLGVDALGTTNSPLRAARIAAASHTLLTPICFSTTADGDCIVST